MTTRPTPTELLDALSHPDIVRHTHNADATLRAALHLALPLSDHLDLQARLQARHLDWRGELVALPRLEATAPASRVREILARELPSRLASLYRGGDRFLDLSKEPVSWLKELRSGARTILTGPDILFGLPRISFDYAPTPEEIRQVCTQLTSARLETGTTLSVQGQELRLVGNALGVLVVSATQSVAPTPALPTTEQIAALGDCLASELRARLVETVDLAEPGSPTSHVEYLFDLGSGLEALVAAHVDGLGAAAVGYPGTWTPVAKEITGFIVDGASILEPGWVARHEGTDIRVLVRHTK